MKLFQASCRFLDSRILLIFCSCSFLASAGQAQSLRISELLAANRTILADQDGDYSDWIEITNLSDSTVFLGDIFLSDNPSKPLKWPFPGASMPAGSHCLVFASGKDRYGDGGEWHSNFKLDKDGESIGLYRRDGSPIHHFAFPEQLDDITYGFPLDDFQMSPGFLTTATPARMNTSIDVGAWVHPPVFSEERGFRSEPFSLILSQEDNLSIRYTLDGSRPTAENGVIYSGSIPINTTTIVRAAAYNSNRQSQTSTHSFIFTEDVVYQDARPSGYPNVWETSTNLIDPISADYGMDNPSHWGGAAEVQASLESLPTISITMAPDSIFGEKGWFNNGGKGNNGAFEKNGSIEWIYPETGRSVQIDGGVQGRSHAADRNRKRGITIKFKKEYGAGLLEHDVFEDAPLNAESRIQKIDRLILRSGMLDTYTGFGNQDTAVFIRDPVLRDAQLAVSGYGTSTTWVHVYLNGLYWGMYAVAERVDQPMLAEKFGGAPEDWMVAKRNIRGNEMGTDEVDGDSKIYDDLVSLILSSNENFTDPAVYDEARRLIDAEDFADYIILTGYHSVGDWPIRNWYFVARSEPPTPGKFYAWDSEVTWQYSRPRYHEPLYLPESEEGGLTLVARLWRSMIKNEDFRLLFRSRVMDLLYGDGLLTPENSLARWNTHAKHIKNAIVAEQARWADMKEPRESLSDWERHIQAVRNQLPSVQDDFLDAFSERRLSVQMWDGLWPPSFSFDEASVPKGTILRLNNDMIQGESQIAYTVDGSDPRDSNGEISLGAVLEFGSPAIRLADEITVSARAVVIDSRGFRWSPLRSRTYQADEVGAEMIVEEVFPNPVREVANIRFTVPDQTLLEIKLYDLMGRELRSIASKVYSGGYHRLNINLAGQSAGHYFLVFNSSEASIARRLALVY